MGLRPTNGHENPPLGRHSEPQVGLSLECQKRVLCGKLGGTGHGKL